MSDDVRAFIAAARVLLDRIGDDTDELPPALEDAYTKACVADVKIRREVPA